MLPVLAENVAAKRHSNFMVKNIPITLFSVPAKENNPKIVWFYIFLRYRIKNSQTNGLASFLDLKVNARVIITTNIDVSDRLIKSKIETVKPIETKKDMFSLR